MVISFSNIGEYSAHRPGMQLVMYLTSTEIMQMSGQARHDLSQPRSGVGTSRFDDIVCEVRIEAQDIRRTAIDAWLACAVSGITSRLDWRQCRRVYDLSGHGRRGHGRRPTWFDVQTQTRRLLREEEVLDGQGYQDKRVQLDGRSADEVGVWRVDFYKRSSAGRITLI